MTAKDGGTSQGSQGTVNYWLCLLSEMDFQVSKQRGFDLIGLPTSMKNAADRPALKDRVIFYVFGLRRFTATCTITSDWSESTGTVWESEKTGMRKPYRATLKRNSALHKDIDALDAAPSLLHVKNWPPDMWEYALIEGGYCQPIPQSDFKYLERELKR